MVNALLSKKGLTEGKANSLGSEFDSQITEVGERFGRGSKAAPLVSRIAALNSVSRSNQHHEGLTTVNSQVVRPS
jgi:hypothetical protein